MYPLDVLPEIILPRPVLWLISAGINVASIYLSIRPIYMMNTDPVSVKIVAGAEALLGLGASFDMAFEGLFVPSSVFF